MRKDVFTRELAPLCANFDCGEEPYALEVSEWIKGESGDVWFAIERLDVAVWLYRTDGDEVIGFGSLGMQEIRLDATNRVLGALLTIPIFGLRKEFRKKPEGPWQNFYARQIFRDLIEEAKAHRPEPNKLALYVHPANAGAIRLYSDAEFGFVKQESWQGYDCMVKDPLLSK